MTTLAVDAVPDWFGSSCRKLPAAALRAKGLLVPEADTVAPLHEQALSPQSVEQRHRELVDGKVKGVPGERVFENLSSRLRR